MKNTDSVNFLAQIADRDDGFDQHNAEVFCVIKLSGGNNNPYTGTSRLKRLFFFFSEENKGNHLRAFV